MKAIKKGEKTLTKNDDLLKPRTGWRPWEKVTDLAIVKGKPAMVKKEKKTKTEKKNLNETDAALFEDLLAPVQIQEERPDDNAHEKKTSNTEGTQSASKGNTQPTNVAIDEWQFVVKRPWMTKSENEEDAVYVNFRGNKSLGTIKDLKGWSETNVMNTPDGKLFETLLESDDLFDNPGLSEHEGARPFFENLAANREVIRASNSREFGFNAFMRTVLKDIFKEKARGLVLRNLEVKLGRTAHREMRVEFGKFLDEVLKNGTEIERNDRRYVQVDKFLMEHIKNDKLEFTTREKIGSYKIDVYCKELCIPKDRWLLLLLQVWLPKYENHSLKSHRSHETKINRSTIKSTMRSAGKMSQQ